MKNVIGVLFVIACVPASMMAAPAPIPEINPAAAMSAVALLGGGVLVIRAYLKK